MQTLLELRLKLNNMPLLAEAFEQHCEIMKSELAENLLQAGAFGKFASANNARIVASETFNLLQLSLLTGDLTAFSNMIGWEIKAVLHNYNFNKYQNDMLYLQILRETLLRKLNPMLADDISTLVHQLTEVFNYHWALAR